MEGRACCILIHTSVWIQYIQALFRILDRQIIEDELLNLAVSATRYFACCFYDRISGICCIHDRDNVCLVIGFICIVRILDIPEHMTILKNLEYSRIPLASCIPWVRECGATNRVNVGD